jgi:hypothetical protein
MGGSWRAYWLDPAQRRYFPQDMATDYIGFRCAMSKVGPKGKEEISKKLILYKVVKALSLGFFLNHFLMDIIIHSLF